MILIYAQCRQTFEAVLLKELSVTLRLLNASSRAGGHLKQIASTDSHAYILNLH